MRRTIALSACLCGALAASPALAESTGAISHGQLRFSLLDLAPTDGINPALTFQPLPVPGVAPDEDLASVLTIAYANGGSEYVSTIDHGADPFTQTLAPSAFTCVTATLSGRAAPLTQQIDIAAHAQFDGPHWTQGHGDVNTPTLWFTLTPHTELTFNTTVRVDADVTGADQINEWFQEASSLYLLLGTWTKQVAWDSDYDMQTAGARDPLVRSLHDDFVLSVTVRNEGDTSLPGMVSFSTWAAASSSNQLPEVPEPGTWAMTLAGLGLLGVRLRAPRMRRTA